jgi:hypothetical protein
MRIETPKEKAPGALDGAADALGWKMNGLAVFVVVAAIGEWRVEQRARGALILGSRRTTRRLEDERRDDVVVLDEEQTREDSSVGMHA